MLFAASASAQITPSSTDTTKPGARWWWMGSAIDKENIAWNMKQYADCGIGALEITPIYGVLGKWEDRLGDRFYRCHRSYLVNLKYVRSYDAESILLRNGTRIFLARDRYSDFVKAYMQYLQTQGGRHV